MQASAKLVIGAVVIVAAAVGLRATRTPSASPADRSTPAPASTANAIEAVVASREVPVNSSVAAVSSGSGSAGGGSRGIVVDPPAAGPTASRRRPQSDADAITASMPLSPPEMRYTYESQGKDPAWSEQMESQLIRLIAAQPDAAHAGATLAARHQTC